MTTTIKPTNDTEPLNSRIHHGWYRIVRRAFRNDDTGAVFFRYYIEHQVVRSNLLILLGFSMLTWKPFEYEVCYEMDCHKEQYRFDTETQARKFIENMEQPLPEDKILEDGAQTIVNNTDETIGIAPPTTQTNTPTFTVDMQTARIHPYFPNSHATIVPAQFSWVRVRRSMSTKLLAKRAGLAERTVKDFERDWKGSSLSTIMKIAKALGLGIETPPSLRCLKCKRDIKNCECKK